MKKDRHRLGKRVVPALLACMLLSSVSSSPAVVPKPALMEERGGSLTIAPDALIIIPDAADPAVERSALVFEDFARQNLGLDFEVARAGAVQSNAGAIIIEPLTTAAIAPERYSIEIDEKVTVRAGTAHGVHNGLMTVLQLLRPKPSGASLPRLTIDDQPRFSWRGLMLDPARSFIPPDEVMRYLDLMAELKLNVFHWHLSDDQGFRIESERFPRLHQIGGTLDSLEPLQKRALKEEGWANRGYYTREEVREIVAYAADRHVMVVPEIDVPGHSSAMLAAYPELSCDGKGAPVRSGRGIWSTALCPGKEEVYEFLDELVSELAELFPAPYFHVGGDEVAAGDWLDYGPNQELMKEHGFDGTAGLQGYFMERVAAILSRHGKTMIAWDEQVGHLPEGVMVQVWRRHGLATDAARLGHPVVVSRMADYLNYSPLIHTMKNLYRLDPIPVGLTPEEQTLILGGEACLWGHEITIHNMDQRLFPRLLAEAEILWTPDDLKNWPDFTRRVRARQAYYKENGVRYGFSWRGWKP